MYAQKEKKYISYQISKQVDPAILGKQIAYELYNRDYSYYDAKDFTIKNDSNTSQMPLFELIERVAEDDTNSFTLEESKTCRKVSYLISQLPFGNCCS